MICHKTKPWVSAHALLAKKFTRPEGQVQSGSLLVIGLLSAMWTYACQCLSSIHQAKRSVKSTGPVAPWILVKTLTTLWCMFTGYFAPTIYVGSLLKSKRSKRRGQKNIQKKAIQTKINSYNKYIKWNITKHYEYSNIVC